MKTAFGTGRLLVRIDDICQRSNWRVLRELESVMVAQGVRPIVAIVPKNMDDNLVIEPPNPTYWEDLSRWQTLGYGMALHGYHHTFAQNGGGIMGLSSHGEFTGLPESVQVDMLHHGIDELESHRIHPTVWVAPRHAFDWTTVAALSRVGIHCISDGFFLAPRNGPCGSLWIPVQVWRVGRPCCGVVTACLHVNRWGTDEILQFRKDLSNFRQYLISLDDITSVAETWPTWNARQIERGDIVNIALRTRQVLSRVLKGRRAKHLKHLS